MLDEKERLTDALITQKYITGGYNLVLTETSHNRLRETLMDILIDEHQIHTEIIDALKNKGWYQTDQADTNQAGRQISNWNQELQKLQRLFVQNIPYYTYQTGLGLPQTTGTPQQQAFYRPPQGHLT